MQAVRRILALAVLFVGCVSCIEVYKAVQSFEEWDNNRDDNTPIVDDIVVQGGVTRPQWQDTPTMGPMSYLVYSLTTATLYIKRFCSPNTASVEDMFIETGPQTSFVVLTKAAYYLLGYTVFNTLDGGVLENANHGDEETGLSISAQFVQDKDKPSLRWLTVDYQCHKADIVKVIGVTLRMIDADEMERDVTFSWRKSCNQADFQTTKKGWLAKLRDLDPSRPLFERLESGPKRLPENSGTALINWIMVLGSIGLLVWIFFLVSDWIHQRYEDEQDEETPDPSEEGNATSTQREEKITAQVAEAQPAPSVLPSAVKVEDLVQTLTSEANNKSGNLM